MKASAVDLVLAETLRVPACDHVNRVALRHEPACQVHRMVLHAPDPVCRHNARDDADAHPATVEEASD